MSEQPDPVNPTRRDDGDASEERMRPLVTRREFLIGAGAGAAAAAAVAGAGTVLRRPAAEPAGPSAAGAVAARPSQPGAPAAGVVLPASQRRVMLSLDGRLHDVTVDVRESLWETMTYTLGLGGVNLGCDRAQCGACAVTVDGRAVNGCTVLSARLGRGQKILTVEGIRTGPGIEGLHPVQRAFWERGGFQCGICTRGFIMSSYALLLRNTSPTRVDIREALAGNICRCSEYPKIYESVELAATELRTGVPIVLGPSLRGIGGAADTSSQAE